MSTNEKFFIYLKLKYYNKRLPHLGQVLLIIIVYNTYKIYGNYNILNTKEKKIFLRYL